MSRFCPEAHAAVRRQVPGPAAAPASGPYTAAELAACARREVRQRRRVYPHLVGRGSMTRDQAEHETAMMTAIAAEYEARSAADPQGNGRLL